MKRAGLLPLFVTVLTFLPAQADSLRFTSLRSREQLLRAELAKLRRAAPTAELLKELRSAKSPSAAFRSDWKAWSDFESKLDAWHAEKRLYVADKIRDELAKRVLNPKDQSRLNDSYAEYLSIATGSARANDYNPLFASYKRFLKLGRSLSLGTKAVFDTRGTKNSAANLLLNPSLIFNQVGVLPRIALLSKSGPGETPVLDQAFEALKKEAHLEGFHDIVTEGFPLENHRRPNPETITLYAHTHSHAFYDYAVIALLNGHGVGVLGHLPHALPGVPEAALSVLRKVDHMVDVSIGDEKAVDRMLELQRLGKLSAYHVATQATTTDGVYGSAINSRLLDSIYVKKIQSHGKKLRIVMATIPQSARLMDLTKSHWDPKPPRLSLRVGETLEDQDLRALTNFTNDKAAVGRFIRFHWLEHIDEGKETVAGAPPLDLISKRILSYALGF